MTAHPRPTVDDVAHALRSALELLDTLAASDPRAAESLALVVVQHVRARAARLLE